MPVPEVTIFTCSYNKPQYISDAIDSVLSQTFTNFEYIILENSTDDKTRNIVHSYRDKRIKIIDRDFSDEDRKTFYMESNLKNIYSQQARGKYIMYLADDDILDLRCFEEHIKEFQKDENQKVNFHSYRIVYLGTDKPAEVIPANRMYGLHTDKRPNCYVDGGSVMFKKEMFEAKEVYEPYFRVEWHHAHFSDGLFLNKLGRACTFYPINKILHTKRITEVSTHTFVDKACSISSYRIR